MWHAIKGKLRLRALHRPADIAIAATPIPRASNHDSTLLRSNALATSHMRCCVWSTSLEAATSCRVAECVRVRKAHGAHHVRRSCVREVVRCSGGHSSSLPSFRTHRRWAVSLAERPIAAQPGYDELIFIRDRPKFSSAAISHVSCDAA